MNGDEKHDETRDEADLDLAQRLGALPRAIAPDNDLWTGVAARIAAKKRRTLIVRRAVTATSVFLAAAAVFVVMRTARHPVATNDVGPAPVTREHVAQKREHAARDLRGAAMVPEEESYDAALTALSATFDERLAALPESDADAIEKSLDVIHEGIEATRAALERDPDDADLRTALDGEYEQEIQTMNDVLEWTTRS